MIVGGARSAIGVILEDLSADIASALEFAPEEDENPDYSPQQSFFLLYSARRCTQHPRVTV